MTPPKAGNRKQRRTADRQAHSDHGRNDGQSQHPFATVAGPLQEEIQHLATLFNQCRYTEAETIARQQIERFPQQGFFWKVLGALLAGQGHSADSLEIMQKAVALLPLDAEAQSNLGLTFHDLGRLHEAEASYRRAVELKPDYAEAQSNLGITLHDLGRLHDAEVCYRRAVALKPDYAEAYSNLGITLHGLGRLHEAEASYRRAVALKPDYAEAESNLGVTLKELGRLPEAETSYRRAVALKPDYAKAHSNLGNTLKELGRLSEAEACYRRAVALLPDYVEALSNLGVTLKELGRLNEAEACCRRAVALMPDYAEGESNLGIILTELGRFPEAEVSCRRAVALKPDYAEAHLNLSLLNLLKGDFENGLPGYEWRREKRKRTFSKPQWFGGEPLGGKTILLHSEQGLGDTLQFCRYARLVAAEGGRVVMEVPASLVELLRGLGGVAELIVQGTTLPPFDYHCPLLSLPLAFKTNMATIPHHASYLRSDIGKSAAWAHLLGEKSQQRVGLAWSGSAGHRNDHNRSILLSEIIPWLPDCFEYVSLQKELRGADRTTLQAAAQIRQFGEYLHDFSDTAALCEQVDLIISVDTSVAHLGAALGKPTWILLPYSPDWRWLLERTDSPWYPSVKLFRQQTPGDWGGVLCDVRAALLDSLGTPKNHAEGVPSGQKIVVPGSQAVLQWSQRTPEAFAVVYATDGYTYATLAEHCMQFARALEWQGVKSGMIVGTGCSNRYFSLVLILALEVIRAVPTSITGSDFHKSDVMGHCNALLTDTPVPNGHTCLLTISITQPWVESVLKTPLTVSDMARLNAPLQENDVVSLGCTSATTGKEKYFFRRRAPLQRRLELLGRRYFSEKNCNFICLYSAMISAGYHGCMLALNHGGTIVLSSLDSLISDIRAFPQSHTTLLPRDAQYVAEHYSGSPLPRKLSSVRVLGAVLPENIRDWLHRHFAEQVVNSYSSNETGQVSEVSVDGSGLIYPGVKVQIVDDNREPVMSGEPGNIAISSPQLIAEYLWDDVLTAEYFKDGWFFSNDVGYLTGVNHLVVMGRKDDMLNLGGVKVAPGPLENRIRCIDGVADCVVMGDMALCGGGSVMVCVEKKPATDGTRLHESVVRLLNGTFTSYTSYYCEKFPRTGTGKIQRKVLLEIVTNQAAVGSNRKKS